MLRLLLAIALLLTLSAATQAQCPGGRCVRPVRNVISAVPTLAPRASTHTARPVKARDVERSVVVRRSVRRGPGLWARITFRPSR